MGKIDGAFCYEAFTAAIQAYLDRLPYGAVMEMDDGEAITPNALAVRYDMQHDRWEVSGPYHDPVPSPTVSGEDGSVLIPMMATTWDDIDAESGEILDDMERKWGIDGDCPDTDQAVRCALRDSEEFARRMAAEMATRPQADPAAVETTILDGMIREWGIPTNYDAIREALHNSQEFWRRWEAEMATPLGRLSIPLWPDDDDSVITEAWEALREWGAEQGLSEDDEDEEDED